MRFSLPSIKCSAAPPSFRLLTSTVSLTEPLWSTISLAPGSSRKLGGGAQCLTDGSEKRICRLSFEFYSHYVIGRRTKISQKPWWEMGINLFFNRPRSTPDPSVPLTWFTTYYVDFCPSYSCKIWFRLLRRTRTFKHQHKQKHKDVHTSNMRSVSNIAGETRCPLVAFLRLCLCSVSRRVQLLVIALPQYKVKCFFSFFLCLFYIGAH